MFITTTPSVEGGKIIEYCGIVFGEAINGIDFAGDFIANITNFTGGHSGVYERETVDVREKALEKMCKHAESLGANAVVGVKVDCRPITIGGRNAGMLMATVSGTAVVLE